ncbi:MAG: glycerate kinase [Oscillospiraceae bacterium]|nr:glycerate kinase [Oscillospiraceae bacterium]
MKIVIAADSFKGSNSAQNVVSIIRRGILKVFPQAETVLLPVADGGEGTVDALLSAAGGDEYFETVLDPLGRPVQAKYGILPNRTAVIETAAASGLTLLAEDERDPLSATTYGTGQLMVKALEQGCRKIVLGLGGSATNDGGAGMAQALGVSLLDENGLELPFGGKALARLKTIDLRRVHPALAQCQIVLACDVQNRLCGSQGASAVYGPQKGAGEADILLLDQALFHYAAVIREQLGQDVASIPGSGAAGGLAAGLLAFCQANIQSGVDTILDALEFEKHLQDADLVITGEGRIDSQSVNGKVPIGVARRSKAVRDIPVIAVVGDIGADAQVVYQYGIDAIMGSVSRVMTLPEVLQNASQSLEECVERMMRLIRIGMALSSASNLR